MERGRRALAIAGSVVILASGCSSPEFDRELRPSGSDPGGSSPARDGPLGAIVLSPSIDDTGVSAEPRLGYTTDDTSVVAVIPLRETASDGATLSVEWFRAAIDDPEPLFEHEITVGPRGVAISEAVASSGIAPGAYEVVAALGDHEVRTMWVSTVADEDVADGSTGPAAAAQGTIAQGAEADDWAAPQAGESSWYSEPTPADPPPPPGPCDLYNIDAVLEGADVSASAYWQGTCSAIDVSISAGGAPRSMIDIAPEPERSQASSPRVWLCALDGGSDLPGTVVDVRGTGSDGAAASESTTLPDNGATVTAVPLSIPEAPAHVEPGQTIVLGAVGVVMEPALGLEKVEIVLFGRVLEMARTPSGATQPIACDPTRFYAKAETTFRVPEDPPASFEVCAVATTFDDHVSQNCQTLFTTDETMWTGTIEAHHVGTDCEGGGEGTMTLKVDGFDVTGSFEASGSYTCKEVTVATGGCRHPRGDDG